MKLEKLLASQGSTRKSPRKGRGNGSKGTFSGRGCKGQNSRSGGGVPVWFEGGQMPLFKRIPKLKGFRNPNKIIYQVTKTSDLEKHFTENSTISALALQEKGIIRYVANPVKILKEGVLTKKFTVEVDSISKTAKELIEKLGGKVLIKEKNIASKTKRIKNAVT